MTASEMDTLERVPTSACSPPAPRDARRCSESSWFVRLARGASVIAVACVTAFGCLDLKPEDQLVGRSLYEGGPGDAAADHDSPMNIDGQDARDVSAQTSTSPDASAENGSLVPDVDASAPTSDGAPGDNVATDAPDVEPPDGQPDVDIDVGSDGDDGFDGDADTGDAADKVDGVNGNDADVSCVQDCPELGNFRCSGNDDSGVPRQIQICSRVRGCLQWFDTATCRSDEVCCEGACRNVELASTCYAPPDFDYYVDAKRGTDDIDAGSSGGGTRQRPFRTVTRAIREATNLPRPGRRIYVAAGTYDSAHGEVFPFELRGGVSIHGAGPNVVTLKGSGSFDHRSAGGIYKGVYQVTLVVGDDTATTTVSGVTVLSAASSQRPNYYGVVCDRGAQPESGDTLGATILDNIVVGPGFHHAIGAVSTDASDASPASGCKLRMYNSTVTGALYGLHAAGCRLDENGNPVSMKDGFPVSIQIGDANRGNSFTWIGSPYNDGAGILVQWCVTQSSIRYNQFRDSTGGAAIDERWEPSGAGLRPFLVEHNVFTNLTSTALGLFGAPVAAVVNDNTFTNISNAPAGPYAANALWVEGEGDGSLPLKKARRNIFIGNDRAVLVYAASGAVTYSGAQGSFDLGTPADPGENQFICNSMVGDPKDDKGGDIDALSAGTGAIRLSGNVWDHFPPTISTSKLNGNDVTLEATPPPTVDTSQGSVHSATCPVDRIRGPATAPDGGLR